ncbi:hypothetical protein SAMN05661091_2126 [Paenibacillus uliginis N3/975]|uniref:HTH arsR-type domain-containing protein n=1 Tax=Paenibacillus uliginis N3/975 TaxID=1313296 RepID=A0A1X7H9Q4_9BACL|nr:metalloregulator ArsR/SmtB family transcription factor [Paenibacillus uliginis]SMF82193.1 hypothetical protein SAMN05661091_2126 [Paenibacillus uliginis N3/975]
MQLEKIVNVHKLLGDPNRMKILMLLNRGEINGQALAEKLSLSQPTVTHHATKLREAALIRERRDKNTIYFSLNPEFIEQVHQASLTFIFGKERGDIPMEDKASSVKATVLRNFFAKDGSLRQIPAQYKKKLIVLEHLVEKLEFGKEYSEKEINEFIKQYHEDFATIRREFIMHHFMYRDNGIYVLNPREMWSNWEEVK